MTTAPDSPYRPAYHFTPQRGWINDPNGLVFFGDQWHLFYQYFNPDEVDGLQWGHAVSGDLVHWQHLPPALQPDAWGHIWSGSAVVDRHDTSGLFGGRAGMVCLFTYWDPADKRQCQGLAYSPDGRTFTKLPEPVIPQLRHLPGQPDDKDFRDPKVFWHELTGRWVMVVAGGKVRIFSSADLIHWRFESVDEHLHTECPDLFCLPLDNGADEHWVLSGGGRWYRLGTFDGRRFTPHTDALPFGHGPDFYATQTWSDAPDARRIAISWLYGWGYESGPRKGTIANPFPTGPWAGGCLTVPCELALRTTPQGPRLVSQPVAGLQRLRRPVLTRESLTAPAGRRRLEGVQGKALEIAMTILPGDASRVALCFPAAGRGHYTVGYDRTEGVLFIDRGASGLDTPPSFSQRYQAPVRLDADGSLALRILLDRCSVELFAGEGEVTMSAFILPDPQADGVDLCVEGADALIRDLRVYAME